MNWYRFVTHSAPAWGCSCGMRTLWRYVKVSSSYLASLCSHLTRWPGAGWSTTAMDGLHYKLCKNVCIALARKHGKELVANICKKNVWLILARNNDQYWQKSWLIFARKFDIFLQAIPCKKFWVLLANYCKKCMAKTCQNF